MTKLMSTLVSWSAKIQPKLKKLWKTVKIEQKLSKKACFLEVFKILFNLGWILALQLTKVVFSLVVRIFWYPCFQDFLIFKERQSENNLTKKSYFCSIMNCISGLFKTPQSNGLYLVMVVQLQLLSNHVLCMSKETLLTDGWPDRNSLAYFFFYSFMMSWFLSQKWLEVTILRSREFVIHNQQITRFERVNLNLKLKLVLLQKSKQKQFQV